MRTPTQVTVMGTCKYTTKNRMQTTGGNLRVIELFSFLIEWEVTARAPAASQTRRTAAHIYTSTHIPIYGIHIH